MWIRCLPSLAVAAFFLYPLSAYASVLFSEIMYDLPGADSGREWVEIHNTGEIPVDISGWKFFENETNHNITANGSLVIPGGGYAVIAANTGKFLADWPQFSGLLFKSSFSLSNTGELLAVKNASLETVASVAYSAEAAEGDGNSLNADGAVWRSRAPSPGKNISARAVVPEAKALARNQIASAKVSIDDSAGSAGAISNMDEVDFLLSDPGHGTSTSIFPWIVALCAVIGIAGAAVFFGKTKRTKSGYTIIEDKS